MAKDRGRFAILSIANLSRYPRPFDNGGRRVTRLLGDTPGTTTTSTYGRQCLAPSAARRFAVGQPVTIKWTIGRRCWTLNMSTNSLHPILIAVQTCLECAALESEIRGVVSEHVSEYEECLDISLSQQLELVSGLADAYLRLCNYKTSPYFDLGEEPYSYADAIRLLNGFVSRAREAVSSALRDATFAFPAEWIGVRAQTFSGVLRCSECVQSEPPRESGEPNGTSLESTE